MAMNDTNTGSLKTDFTDDEAAAITTHILQFGDDEFVHGDRLLDWHVKTPTLEAHLTLANILQDELGHAREWYELYTDVVDLTVDGLIYERDHDEFFHCTLVELPFERGEWSDAVVRMYLYDVAERLRIENIQRGIYEPVDDLVGKVLDEERFHRDHATEWINTLTQDEDGRDRVQTSINRLLPYALALFESASDEQLLVEMGFLERSGRKVRNDWFDEVSGFFGDLGIEMPVSSAADLDEVEFPEHIGRGKSHTNHWIELHLEQTAEYRDLGLQKSRSTI